VECRKTPRTASKGILAYTAFIFHLDRTSDKTLLHARASEDRNYLRAEILHDLLRTEDERNITVANQLHSSLTAGLKVEVGVYLEETRNVNLADNSKSAGTK
jgi:hypothetical protein